jgi:hypothetical protein
LYFNHLSGIYDLMPDIWAMIGSASNTTNQFMFTAGVVKAGPAQLSAATWRDMDLLQEMM